jgi:hypothetical protein
MTFNCRRLFALFAVFQSFSLFSQDNFSEQQFLVWSPESAQINSSELFFKDAFKEEKFNGLPVFKKNYALQGQFASFEAEIRVIKTSILEKSLISSFQNQFVGADFKVEALLRYGANDAYGVVSVLPIRKNSKTGQFEKLEEFELICNAKRGAKPQKSQRTTAEHSVLQTGTWYKIAIDKDGIYRIDRDLLEDLGIDTESLDPGRVNIYGNGGQQLPYNNSEFRHDDLVLNTLFAVGENDSSFDEGDYFLFYGKGPDTWKRSSETADYNPLLPDHFVHKKHFYSDSAYYFIRIDDEVASRMPVITSSPDPSNYEVNKFQDRAYIENDQVNFVKSGRNFFGEHFFDNTINYNFSFSMPDVLQVPAILRTRVAGRTIGAADDSFFTISVDGTSQNIDIIGTSTSTTADLAKLGFRAFEFTPVDGNITVNFTFNKANAEAEGWLDYVGISVSRALKMSGSFMAFRDTTSAGPGRVSDFVISNGNLLSEIWEITDPTQVAKVQFTNNGGICGFRLPTETTRDFVAFNTQAIKTPRAVGQVQNQDLHALADVDLVIVSPPGLKSAAATLADHHAMEGSNVVLVTPNEIYNEFSSGNRDVTAIKMLMKMLYDRAEGNEALMPKQLLLFGDGSFNNRIASGTAANYIITYQSDNSISPTNSYVSDDYFAFLDDEEGESIEDKLDIGVGRLPVSGLEQAQNMVRKIRNYSAANSGFDINQNCGDGSSGSVYGSWRNTILFVSDDQDGNVDDGITHMRNSDVHADSIRLKYAEYDIDKIYLDAYTQEISPGGERYPEAEELIRRKVQNGALIVNYIGHGGERGWAHERILDIPTIQNWSNFNRLPLFMTATCELSRYDDPGFESAGELTLLNPNGGAIALLTTTRIVFSGSNQRLGRAFYNVALEDETIENLTLGEVARRTKNDTIALLASENMRNFSLLGDPALKLSYPKYNVYTTLINGNGVEVQDTVRALQEVTISGFVGDYNGNVLEGFNGYVYPTVFDKAQTVVTQNNDDQINPFEFETFKNIIYKGKASVVNGNFTFSFIIPRDISYSFGVGRVSYYAVESQGSNDAHGYSEEFVIGGALDGAALNNEGPVVELFMNDERFVSGGVTAENPIIYAKVSDENGVNTVGNGIGHDITAVLDGETENAIILNDYYESDLDTYKSGTVRYQLESLEEGPHTLEFKIWDVHNNSSSELLDFVVASNAELALEHVLNYPNPFTTRTQFYFEHNQACDMLEVRLQVFTVGGKLVKTFDRMVMTEGYRSEPIEWDGLDDFGDPIARGVYVYKLDVRTPEGKQAEAFEKLVILR